MYELLIVDDEKFAVEGTSQCNDWQNLGIYTIHTANHADEARIILLEHRIDILICDIEMPDEDGLSLVRWVKEYSPHTEVVFLTCHSDFTYAKQAINLGSCDYLLKPVDSEELAQAVSRMLQVIQEKEENSNYNRMYQKYMSLWNKQQPLLAERFWQDLLSRRILSFGDFLERALQDMQIGLSPDARILPVLISVEAWKKTLDTRDQEIMEYALKKAAGELFLSDNDGHVITDKNGVMFVMVYSSEPAHSSPSTSGYDRWLKVSKRFIEICQEYFYCQVTCYVGRFAPLQELPRLCEGLKNMERNNVSRTQSALLYPNGIPAERSPSSVPDNINVSEWSNYMLQGDRDKMVDLIHRSVEKWEGSTNIQLKHIETYYYDMLQVIYSFLHMKGLSTNQVPHFSMWASAQIRSLSQYKHWAENMILSVMDIAYASKEMDSVVQKSIQYMKENVEEDISRENVAAYVSLNPAYLSRLFKKETGQNLIDYLIETKMNRAKQLMDSTGMTVSAIAQQVGYSNFSHFTKMFKKQFSVNPQEYRKS